MLWEVLRGVSLNTQRGWWKIEKLIYSFSCSFFYTFFLSVPLGVFSNVFKNLIKFLITRGRGGVY